MSYLYYLYLLRSRLVVVMIYLYEKYDWFLMKSRNCLLFVNTCVHSWFLVGSVLVIFLVFCVVLFGGIRVGHLFSFLCCVIWWDPC